MRKPAKRSLGADVMQVQSVALASLKPPERNGRQHPDAQIVELMRAIEMFGQTRPVVIDEDDTVLAGNGLVMALQRLQRETAQIIRITGLSPGEKTKLMLSDNKIFSLGYDDYDSIMSMIRGLDDFDIPGFDSDMLSGLIGNEDIANASLEEFGRLSDERKAQMRDQPTGTVSREAGQTSVLCPHCGKGFAIS